MINTRETTAEAIFFRDDYFLFNTKEEAIDFKIEILYEMEILHTASRYSEFFYGDKHEEAIRYILKHCKTYERMDQILRPLIKEEIDVDRFVEINLEKIDNGRL